MGIVVLVLVVAALVGAVVLITRRSAARERSSGGAAFWPQSPVGQIGAVVLGLLVFGLLLSMSSW